MTGPAAGPTVCLARCLRIAPRRLLITRRGSTGVVVNSVTRSGTNRFGGRVFEYFQDNSLAATDYFLKQAGEKNGDFGSNVFGGSIGGPIVKNKAFFFFNYEGTRARSRELEFPAAGRAACGVVFDHDGLQGTEHLSPSR